MNTPILCADAVTHVVATTSGPLSILDNVNLCLETGESIAIQGASGSGKSTLLNLLAGLDLPSNGQIVFQGNDITRLDEDQRAALRANSIGFVFQSFHLIDDLTALENVALPLELFSRSKPLNIARTWLGQLGLTERTAHFPRQLSGGEQQRVALARAFAVSPSLLFADEPTANLDVATADNVLEHLFELQKNANASMVIATHDHKLAQRCDRTYQFINGELTECEY